MADPITLGALATGYFVVRDQSPPVGDAPTKSPTNEGREVSPVSGRGLIVGLSASQRLTRALYVAGEVPLVALDPSVRKGNAPAVCPDLYYRLKDFNGGKDPTASDPATRWIVPGGQQVNRTSDCIGGAAWIGGFDRFQPARFAHIFGGWINTDSMLQDAVGPQRCFATIETPSLGCYVVSSGRTIDHIGTVIGIPTGIEYLSASWWRALGVVDIAAREGRANKRTTGAGWASSAPRFIVPLFKS